VINFKEVPAMLSKRSLNWILILLLVLSALPSGAATPTAKPVSIETAVRAAAALGMHQNPGALVRSMDRNPRVTDPDWALRLRLRGPKTEPMDLSTRRSPAHAAAPIGRLGAGSCDLRAEGNVSGLVRDLDGLPLEGIEVDLLPEGQAEPAADFGLVPLYSYSAFTDAEGRFTIPFEEAGFYRILAWDPSARHLAQYYDHAASWEQATVLNLTEGQTVEGITFDLPAAGSIAGRATDAATGEGIWGLYVYAYDIEGGGWELPVPRMGFGYTDANGNYRLEGLAPGTYEVQMYDFGNFYPGAVYGAPVPVAQGQAVSGIDFALQASSTGIKGTVTTPEGLPVSLAWIMASTVDGYYGIWGQTDMQGRFRLGVEAGSYAVQAVDGMGDYLPTYYPGVSAYEDALLVEVPQGRIVAGIDFALLPAARITGQAVSALDGTPLEGIYIQAFDVSGEWKQSAMTDASGAFSLGGLDSGTYRLWAYDFSSRLSDEWYRDKADFESADAVAATAGQVTSGINFAMDPAGSISGTVVDALTGQPLADIYLIVWGADGKENPDGGRGGYGVSGPDGTYAIGGLGTGSYILYAYDFTGYYLPTYYDNVTALEQATPIAVAKGHDTPGILVRMGLGGTVTGRIMDARTSAPLPSTFVTAFAPDDSWVGMGFSTEDGTYVITALPTGSYYLHAQEWSGLYASKWYPDADRIEDADAVSVTEGSPTSGIDFVLPPAGSISGRVTDLQGTPMAFVPLYAQRSDSRQIWMEQFWGYTDENGDYVITGLGTGDYWVVLMPWFGSVYYYPGTQDPEDAETVHAVQGQDTSGIDFAIAAGGGISGTVTDALTGAPVISADVMVLDGFGMTLSWTATDENGFYQANWLPPGSYKVLVSARFYLPEWYKDAPSFEEAQWVDVAEDIVTPRVDFTLAPMAGSFR
jgi:hypothetical protein